MTCRGMMEKVFKMEKKKTVKLTKIETLKEAYNRGYVDGYWFAVIMMKQNQIQAQNVSCNCVQPILGGISQWT